jgi:hypothetical protein
MTARAGSAFSQSALAHRRPLAIYLGVIAVGNLAWESLHLPLYTLWRTGTPGEKVFAVIHCTAGDILIGLSTLVLALVLVGDRRWPVSRYWPVASAAIGIGLTYTMFSEWLNISVRATWAYSEYMPVLPMFEFSLGLSPILQWLIVPSLGFWASGSHGLAHRSAT